MASNIPAGPAIGDRRSGQSWGQLSRAAQVYVVAVIAAGAYSIVAFLPLSFPRPLLFAFLLVTSCLTSVWKVNLPIPLASGSTLSVSYAADLMTLLLLGPRAAVLVAAAGVWTQCTVKIKRPYPLLPDDLQHRRRSADDGGDGRAVQVARRALGSGRLVAARQASGWNDCDLLCRQHRPRRGGDRPDVPADVRRRSGSRISCGAAPASWWLGRPGLPQRS